MSDTVSEEEADAFNKLIENNREEEVESELGLLGDKAKELCQTTGKKGFTPLHTAAFFSRERILSQLLSAGADVNLPLRATVRRDVYWYETGSTPLHIASSKRHEEIVAGLIERGADVSATNAEHALQTPLHAAAEHGFMNNATLLVDAGANTSCSDYAEETPLHKAARHGHNSVLMLLISHHANTECLNNQGHTPLLLAVMEGHMKSSVLLLENGSNVSIVDGEGNNALAIAIIHKREDLVPLLLDNGITPTSCNHLGLTPLHLACDQGLITSVKLLVGSGADMNKVDSSGKTALHYAATAGNAEIVYFLLNAGVDKTIMDGEDHTADFYTTLKEVKNLLTAELLPHPPSMATPHMVEREKTSFSLKETNREKSYSSEYIEQPAENKPIYLDRQESETSEPPSPRPPGKPKAEIINPKTPRNQFNNRHPLPPPLPPQGINGSTMTSSAGTQYNGPVGLDKQTLDAVRKSLSSLETQVLTLCLGDDTAVILYRRLGKLSTEIDQARQIVREASMSHRPNTPRMENNRGRSSRFASSSPSDLPSPRNSSQQENNSTKQFNPNFMVETIESLKSELHLMRQGVKPAHAGKLDHYIRQVETLALTVVTLAHLISANMH